jgi:glycosyltransferase involved in cell wall biosynthesis
MPVSESPSLCIVIPCHNEALCIGGVVRDFRSQLPGAQILVINNASSDATAQVAAEAGATVINEPRKGKATAIVTALERVDTDLIIMIDGDGSYPAKGAVILLDKYREHPVDSITGIRRAHDQAANVFRPMHQLGTHLFALCTRLVFGYQPRDVFSGLRLFSRRFYKNVPILSSGFELEMELTIQTVDKGFSFTEVEVPFQERSEGTKSKLRTFRDGYRILRALLLMFRDYKPLYFFGAIALFFFVLGLLAGLPPVIEYYQTGQVLRFPLAILAAALVNISIFTFLTGLVSETNLRYHREAFQISLRNFPATSL